MLRSGIPFNITTGRDNNGDTEFSDRPAFGVPGEPEAIATPLGLFNPNPQPGDTIVPRDFGREGHMLRADLQVSKTTTWGERTATLTVAVNNLLNTTSLASFNGVVTSPRFDQPNRALPARSLTFSVGVSF